jgi:hypothetical protein
MNTKSDSSQSREVTKDWDSTHFDFSTNDIVSNPGFDVRVALSRFWRRERRVDKLRELWSFE